MKVYLGENEIQAIWLSVKVAFVLQVFLISTGLSVSQSLSRNFFQVKLFGYTSACTFDAPPVVFVLCRARTGKFLAEITINSEEKLSISTGEKCYAIIKTVSIIPYKVRKVQSLFFVS